MQDVPCHEGWLISITDIDQITELHHHLLE